MYRSALVLLLATQAAGAFAAGACSIAGTAYDPAGRPMHDAVLRLTDLTTQHTRFAAADDRAAFAFDGIAADELGRYRIDVLGPPTIVTGTKIPTRSIVGMTDPFACAAGQLTRQDVHALVF